MKIQVITASNYNLLPWNKSVLREVVEQLLTSDLKPGLSVSSSSLEEAMTSPFADVVFVVDLATTKLAGYAELHEWRSATGRVGYIENVVRANAYKGQGIGPLLGRELMAAVRRRGLKKVWLRSGAWRKGAHKLYDSLGFDREEGITIRYKNMKGAQK